MLCTLTQQAFIDCLLYARHRTCTGETGISRKKQTPCLCGAHGPKRDMSESKDHTNETKIPTITRLRKEKYDRSR